MRALLLITVLAAMTAWANPKAMLSAGDGKVVLASTYLNSERLQISVSTTDAVFSGLFTFAADARVAAPSNTIGIYLWIPEEGVGDPSVEAFWKASGGDTRRAANFVQLLDRTVGLKVTVGERELKLGSGIYFSTTPYRPPVPLSRQEERLRAIFERNHPMPEPDKLDEPGFCLLTTVFVCDGMLISNRTPVTVNYRQPLARSAGGARFFYMPVFDRVPESISTADTNRYSITFVARGCSLAVTNGTLRATLGSGESVTFSPQRHQPFRALVTGGRNPQGGANGRQPVGPETNRTSAAAASRRSP
jgi:hypothetical protein